MLMTKVSTDKIGFTILLCLILIAPPLLINPSYSLIALPGVPSSLIESNLLDTINSNSSNGNNGILDNLLELDESTGPVNTQDDITRENLKELLAGSVNNKFLSNEIAGNVEAVEEGNRADNLDTARSLQEKKFTQLESLELATDANVLVSDLNGIFSKCDPTKSDMAVHTIKGKTDFNKILGNVKNNDDISIELIVDNKPTETSLILVGSPSVFLKGSINTNPYDSDPTEYDYDISHINTDCIAKTLTDKQLEIKSGIKEPLIIPKENRISGTTAQFFQPCADVSVGTGSDFSKYKLIGTSKEIQHKDLSINGKVESYCENLC